MSNPSPGWKQGVLVGFGAIDIISSILVFIHPGMTVVTIICLLGIILIIVGIEKIISGIFVKQGSKWRTEGLGILALIFGSISVGYPVSTAVLVKLCWALVYYSWVSLIYYVGWEGRFLVGRGFSIGAGALAVAISFLVMASPFAGAVFVSVFLGIALLIGF